MTNYSFPTLSPRLGKYTLAAATVCAGSAFLPQKSDAALQIFTNSVTGTRPRWDGTSSLAFSSATGSFLNNLILGYTSPQAFYNPFSSHIGLLATDGVFNGDALVVGSDYTIGSGSPFAAKYFNYITSPPIGSSNVFLGFQFLNRSNGGTSSGTDTWFGWAEVSATGSGFDTTYTVHRWAFDNMGNEVTTPAPIPEPSATALMASGLAGLAALRRRRKTA